MSARPESPPLVIVDKIKNAMRIVAYEADERLKSIVIQQSLGDARALVPDLECVQYDATGIKELLHQLARWCERYTPLVAISGDDGLFLDITGCAHLFGGEQNLLHDLEARFKAQGFAIRCALADTPGAAWALSRYSRTQTINSDTMADALADLPLDALRISSQEVRELGRVGFKTIGALAELPRAPVASRFGSNVLRRLDQALRREDEVLSPLQPISEFVSEKRFVDPIVHEDDIQKTIALLAANMQPALEQNGVGIRACEIVLFRVDGETLSLRVEASVALQEPDHIARLFEEKISGLHNELDAGFGFDVIRLCVLRAERRDAKQHTMIDQSDADHDIHHLVDRLSARLGKQRIKVFQLADTHIPERRIGFISATDASTVKSASAKPLTGSVTRPLILFNRPELTDVVAEVPEGPPIQFRWRKAHYEIVRSEGPERIACEWWREGRAAHTRDYFCVEDKDGYRFWLFRHGLYERETNRPKWYMHGLFG